MSSSNVNSFADCSRCHGNGVIDIADVVRCAGCQGTGRILGNPCDSCDGTGTVAVIVKAICPICFPRDALSSSSYAENQES
jgi:DnaJ-class molecular chaperone